MVYSQLRAPEALRLVEGLFQLRRRGEARPYGARYFRVLFVTKS